MRPLVLLIVSFQLLGCGDDDGVPDGAMRCVADGDCDDGLFCNGAERCDLSSGAANGCVASAPACAGGESCDEMSRLCGPACSAPDADGDGAAAVACGGNDCDDTDPNRFPDNAEVCDLEGHDEDCDPTTFGDRDLDNDGFVDARCCNGSNCGEDCDETRRGTNPTVPEVCDGRDNDCDGTVDEELLQDVFADADRDLHGDPDAPVRACPGRAGTSISMLDCDDADPMTNGPQSELRDGADNDCDGNVDEAPVDHVWYADTDGDGYGDPTSDTMTSDAQPDGYALLPIDCDDDDASRSPVATESCNGVDDDCDGEANFVIGVNDWEDDDGDGVADSACGGNDCDDTDPITFEGASERCDLRDNDCDGRVDEACSTTPPDAGVDAGVDVGVDAGPSCMPTFEICNGEDDDCDGSVDETLSCASSIVIDAAVGVTHTCAIVAPGALYCWGSTSGGKVGNGIDTGVVFDTPQRIGSGLNWVEVDTSQLSTCAMQGDGSVFCWGRGDGGSVGDGSGGGRSVPTFVSGLTASHVEVGTFHACALDTANRIWCWGRGVDGSNGTFTDQLIPLQVGSEVWDEFTVGHRMTCGRRGGGAYCWGARAGGVLPTAVPTLIAGTATLDFLGDLGAGYDVTGLASGALFTWNHIGAASRVGADSDWIWTATGSTTMLARKADGRVLEDGVTQVGVHTDYRDVFVSQDHFCGIRPDGSLWCWGTAASGVLGVSGTPGGATPVQVVFP